MKTLTLQSGEEYEDQKLTLIPTLLVFEKKKGAKRKDVS